MSEGTPERTDLIPVKDEGKDQDIQDNGIDEVREEEDREEGVEKFVDAVSEHKLEDVGEATADDVAPNLVETNSSGDTKLMKDLDDEAPKTFPQVVSYFSRRNLYVLSRIMCANLYLCPACVLRFPADGYPFQWRGFRYHRLDAAWKIVHYLQKEKICCSSASEIFQGNQVHFVHS